MYRFHSTVSKYIDMNDIIEEFGEDKILSCCHYENIKQQQKISKAEIEKIKESGTNKPEDEYERKINNRRNYYEMEVKIDEDDVDIECFSDIAIADEFNRRKLDDFIDSSNHKSIKEFIRSKYDINVDAYTNDELIEFIKEHI